MRRAPLGFYLAAVCAAFFGAAMLVVLLVADTENSMEVWQILWLRVAAAALAALSGVAVEALWFARRWAYHATLTLALAYAATVTAVCVATIGLEGLFAALIVLTLSAMVVLPIVFFVRDASIGLFGIPRRRPPPPQPVMRPVPPHVRRQRPPPPWW